MVRVFGRGDVRDNTRDRGGVVPFWSYVRIIVREESIRFRLSSLCVSFFLFLVAFSRV